MPQTVNTLLKHSEGPAQINPNTMSMHQINLNVMLMSLTRGLMSNSLRDVTGLLSTLVFLLDGQTKNYDE